MTNPYIEMDVMRYKDITLLRFERIKRQINDVFMLVHRWNAINDHNDLQLVIAGGVWRGLFDDHDVIDDVDLFVVGEGTEDERITYINRFIQYNHEYAQNQQSLYLTFCCPNQKLYTFRTIDNLKVQLINSDVPKTTKQLLERFDIRACKIAHLPIMHGMFLMHEQARQDIYKKEIVIETAPYPLSTLVRVEKYKRKGYTVSDIEMQQVCIAMFEQMSAYQKENPDLFRNPLEDKGEVWKGYFQNSGRRYID